ncbi:hypothetical protein ACA910_011432 [Epithemia clementina (nom. ined.)]
MCLPPQGRDFDVSNALIDCEWIKQGSKGPKIKCPTVYGKDAYCWQRLLEKESSLCLDAPVMLSTAWTEAMHCILGKHLSSPVKLASTIARCIHHPLRELAQSGGKRPFVQDIKSGDKRVSTEDWGKDVGSTSNHLVRATKKPRNMD